MSLGHKRPKHANSGMSGDADEPEEGDGSVAMADSLNSWVGELAAAYGLDPTAIDRELLLDVSRAAHRVARAAAPFTLLLIGLAAGRDGGGAEAVNRAAATARRLAANHARPAAEGGAAGTLA